MKRVDVCVITRIICESRSNYKKKLVTTSDDIEGFTLFVYKGTFLLIECKSQVRIISNKFLQRKGTGINEIGVFSKLNWGSTSTKVTLRGIISFD